ncbi:hypothetical protein FGB62_200g013 [Gracilaria domingensis]|nr:hypothetical protein FGB62_200g013 [Gracilaria domingensis]
MPHPPRAAWDSASHVRAGWSPLPYERRVCASGRAQRKNKSKPGRSEARNSAVSREAGSRTALFKTASTGMQCDKKAYPKKSAVPDLLTITSLQLKRYVLACSSRKVALKSCGAGTLPTSRSAPARQPETTSKRAPSVPRREKPGERG